MLQQELLKKEFQMVIDIVRHDPFANLRQTMDRLFDDSFFRTPARLFDERTLPVDISEQGERFYRCERSLGSVSHRIALPGIVHDTEVEAELKSGVLPLYIPLPEKARPKQIAIKNGD